MGFLSEFREKGKATESGGEDEGGNWLKNEVSILV